MSEKMRLAVIVAVFALVGVGIFRVFSGGGDDASTPNASNTPTIETKSGTLPDMSYAPLTASEEEEDEEETPMPVEEEKNREEDPDSSDEKITSVQGMTGPGTLKGIITIADGSPLPSDTMIYLYFIHKKSETDASMDILIQSKAPDAAGKYTFENLPLGNYSLFGNAEGYTGSEDQWLGKGREQRDADLQMFPAATISGIVQTMDGTPVPGAHISVAGYKASGDKFRNLHPSRSRASTVAAAEDGQFVIGNLQIHSPTLQYRLLAVAPGYPVTITENSIDTGATGIIIILGTGSAVSGHVIHAETQEPMANLKLTLNAEHKFGNQEIASSVDGSFTFTGISAGEHSIQIPTTTLRGHLS